MLAPSGDTVTEEQLQLPQRAVWPNVLVLDSSKHLEEEQRKMAAQWCMLCFPESPCKFPVPARWYFLTTGSSSVFNSPTTNVT